jgi:hypothetical protein
VQDTATRREKTFPGLATVLPPHNSILSKRETAEGKVRATRATYTTAISNFPNQPVKVHLCHSVVLQGPWSHGTIPGYQVL